MADLYLRLAKALLAGAGGFRATPPGLFDNRGAGIPDVFAVTPIWDAVATTTAPDLPVDEVHFVCLDDGTLVVDEEVPDDSLAPLAEAIEGEIARPYRAAGVRHEHGLWGIAAVKVEVATLSADVEGDSIELSSYAGERTVTIDGEPAARELPELEALGEREGPDFALHAERLDGTTWVVEVSSL